MSSARRIAFGGAASATIPKPADALVRGDEFGKRTTKSRQAVSASARGARELAPGRRCYGRSAERRTPATTTAGTPERLFAAKVACGSAVEGSDQAARGAQPSREPAARAPIDAERAPHQRVARVRCYVLESLRHAAKYALVVAGTRCDHARLRAQVCATPSELATAWLSLRGRKRQVRADGRRP